MSNDDIENKPSSQPPLSITVTFNNQELAFLLEYTKIMVDYYEKKLKVMEGQRGQVPKEHREEFFKQQRESFIALALSKQLQAKFARVGH